MSAGWHVASLVVRCLPERMAEVGASLARLPGTELRAAERGRLVVLLEGEHEGRLADALVAIRALDGVLAADPVFHQYLDPAEDDHVPQPP